MTKDWGRYRGEINTLYINNGKSLDDVRRILKGRHRFDASVRAYRMKLEEWGIRKNKITTNNIKKANHSRSMRAGHRNWGSLKTKPPNVISSLLVDNSTSILTSDPVLHGHGDWIPSLNFSSYGQNLNNSNLESTAPFQEHSSALYVEPNHDIDFTTQDQSLHLAVSRDAEEEVNNLLSSGVSVHTRDGFNNAPLHNAVSRGNTAIVKTLLNYGADINAIGFKHKTPLHLAVVSKKLVQLLLKHHPTLSLQDDEGNTILHHMLLIKEWWVDLDIQAAIRTILSSGGDVNIANKLGESPLHQIVTKIIPASTGYMNMVSEFLNYTPNVTSPMRNGMSLLAVFLDNSDILTKDTTRYLGSSKKVGFQCLEQIVNAGADLNIKFHSKPLIIHCLEKGSFSKNGPSQKFLMMLLQKADLDVMEAGGNCPLHVALSRGTYLTEPFTTYAAVAALVARKVDVNQQNYAGASPLELCLSNYWRKGQEGSKVALLLIKAGAVTTILTSTGQTLFDLLIYLTREERICITKALLEAGINSEQDSNDVREEREWVGAWRSTWKQTRWHLAKVALAKLKQLNTPPKSKDFHECAVLVTIETLLDRHKSQLELWQTGSLDKEIVRENYEEYCVILRDCREQMVEIDASWYMYLLDLIDFK